jgi:hypothetical protein
MLRFRWEHRFVRTPSLHVDATHQRYPPGQRCHLAKRKRPETRGMILTREVAPPVLDSLRPETRMGLRLGGDTII